MIWEITKLVNSLTQKNDNYDNDDMRPILDGFGKSDNKNFARYLFKYLRWAVAIWQHAKSTSGFQNVREGHFQITLMP